MKSSPSLRVSHASGLHEVERTLADLHHDMLRLNGESEAIRLSVVNIVAACSDVDSADIATQTVGHLAATHPARAIVITGDPEAPDGIEADLSLQSAARGSGQVCAELIRLTVSGEPAHHLASIVTPLIVADVPVYLWLVGSPPLRQAFGHDAITICERIIIDTGAYPGPAATLKTLDREMLRTGRAGLIADLSWARGQKWRELIAQAFSGAETRPLMEGITRVELECSGEQPSSQAWLLAGWLASRLRWASSGVPEVAASARYVPDVAARELLKVRLTCAARGQSGTVTLERYEDKVQTTIAIASGLHTTYSVAVDTPDIVHLVGSMMEDGESGGGPMYAEALTRAGTLAAIAGDGTSGSGA